MTVLTLVVSAALTTALDPLTAAAEALPAGLVAAADGPVAAKDAAAQRYNSAHHCYCPHQVLAFAAQTACRRRYVIKQLKMMLRLTQQFSAATTPLKQLSRVRQMRRENHCDAQLYTKVKSHDRSLRVRVGHSLKSKHTSIACISLFHISNRTSGDRRKSCAGSAVPQEPHGCCGHDLCACGSANRAILSRRKTSLLVFLPGRWSLLARCRPLRPARCKAEKIWHTWDFVALEVSCHNKHKCAVCRSS